MSIGTEDEGLSALFDAFARWHPRLVDKGLRDFSGLRTGAAPFCRIAPRKQESISEIIKTAKEHQRPIRLRAQGHSLNGSSLPSDGELLLSSNNIRQVRFLKPGTVTVGSGVVLWILQRILREIGFDLPVLNDGYPGPTVGGYLSAGGFGPRSARYGGYWDNVMGVSLIDGRGQLLHVNADDKLFPWLFGSMGQLGMVFEVTLSIIPREDAETTAYPHGKAMVAPQLVDPPLPPEFATEKDESLFWFTLFVPDAHLEAAHRDLRELELKHQSVLRFQQRYNYPIRFLGNAIPPLIYGEGIDLTATGAWGWLTDSSPQGLESLTEFDGDFQQMITQNPHYRRYVQSELPSSPEIYQQCFGLPTYTAFREIKRQLDPGYLFNRGSVFSPIGKDT